MDVLLESHTIHAMGILVGAVLVAVLAETVLMRLASRITRRTKNEVDDKIVAADYKMTDDLQALMLGAADEYNEAWAELHATD